MEKRVVLLTGASGYIASQLREAFRDRFELRMVDVRSQDRGGGEIPGVEIADLIDPDRSKYAHLFEGVDAVVHLGYKRSRAREIDRFDAECDNVRMANNVYRAAFDAGVRRVVMASSNHAADYYERLIWADEWDVVTPEMRPLSDNFYGWAKEAYEHLGFVFAAGNVNGNKLQNVQLRIGAPRETILDEVEPKQLKRIHRGLGAYLSARDQTQLFIKSIETEYIEDENGVPFQVFYGISGNSHSFWSIVNARKIIGYEPEDNSAVKFAEQIKAIMSTI